jgi:hypothetical protein
MNVGRNAEVRHDSPFPGMDPYIEASGLWGDFQGALIHEIARALAPVLPEHYLVRTEERSYVVLAETEGKESRSFLPDVGVTTSRSLPPSSSGGGVTTAPEMTTDTEVVTLRAFIEDQHRESFIEIYEAEPEQRLVTCVELLSPSNKQSGAARVGSCISASANR